MFSPDFLLLLLLLVLFDFDLESGSKVQSLALTFNDRVMVSESSLLPVTSQLSFSQDSPTVQPLHRFDRGTESPFSPGSTKAIFSASSILIHRLFSTPRVKPLGNQVSKYFSKMLVFVIHSQSSNTHESLHSSSSSGGLDVFPLVLPDGDFPPPPLSNRLCQSDESAVASVQSTAANSSEKNMPLIFMLEPPSCNTLNVIVDLKIAINYFVFVIDPANLSNRYLLK
mmetsp:Transcript_7370/g.8916  ORF Transcript_7370/g.8916 Transcript_7370/m.8916 type:complete len:226 (-) Transcript_7370:8-685(-)